MEEIFTNEFSTWLHKRAEATVRARNWFGVNAADLAQDVLMSIFKASEKGKYTHEGDAQLRAFAIKAMRNLAINTMGSYKRKEGNVKSLDAIAGEDDRAFDVIDTRGDVDPRIADLHNAVAKLKGRRREVMELTLAGYKVREIVATGRFETAAAVSQLKHNAMVDVRRIMAAGVE